MRDLSRREMIELAVLGLSLPALGCFETGPKKKGLDSSATVAPPTQVQRDAVVHLAKGRKKLEQARKCGQLWLDDQTERPGYTVLFNGLIANADRTPSQLVKEIKAQHIVDIEAQRFETVAGWTLSRTETHLYALLALHPSIKTDALSPTTGQ